MRGSLDHVFLAWRCRQSPRIFPIGRLLSFDGGGFEFAYVHAVEEAQQHGFRSLVSFPDLGVVYRSKTLPALFSNRVMRTTRPDYPAFVSELGLEPDAPVLEVLGRSGGRRVTDSLEVFSPPVQRADGTFEMHSLVRGVSHIPAAEDAIAALRPGERLLLMKDEQNPFGAHARLLRTTEPRLVGFLPDYLARELDSLGAIDPSAVAVTVEKVNLPPAPTQHRLLCRIQLPGGRTLFRGERYAPLPADATPVAA